MFKPSTAPRWKIATSIFFRASAACAERATNAGANPRLTIARLPFLRNTRRVIMVSSFNLAPGLRTSGFWLRTSDLAVTDAETPVNPARARPSSAASRRAPGSVGWHLTRGRPGGDRPPRSATPHRRPARWTAGQPGWGPARPVLVRPGPGPALARGAPRRQRARQRLVLEAAAAARDRH